MFAKKPELKNNSGILYFLELNDVDGTKFYKIGITMNLQTRYYDFIKNNGGKICWSVPGTLYECFQREQLILNKYKEYKYTPELKMAGKTECLNKEVSNDF